MIPEIRFTDGTTNGVIIPLSKTTAQLTLVESGKTFLLSVDQHEIDGNEWREIALFAAGILTRLNENSYQQIDVALDENRSITKVSTGSTENSVDLQRFSSLRPENAAQHIRTISLRAWAPPAETSSSTIRSAAVTRQRYIGSLIDTLEKAIMPGVMTEAFSSFALKDVLISLLPQKIAAVANRVKNAFNQVYNPFLTNKPPSPIDRSTHQFSVIKSLQTKLGQQIDTGVALQERLPITAPDKREQMQKDILQIKIGELETIDSLIDELRNLEEHLVSSVAGKSEEMKILHHFFEIHKIILESLDSANLYKHQLETEIGADALAASRAARPQARGKSVTDIALDIVKVFCRQKSGNETLKFLKQMVAFGVKHPSKETFDLMTNLVIIFKQADPNNSPFAMIGKVWTAFPLIRAMNGVYTPQDYDRLPDTPECDPDELATKKSFESFCKVANVLSRCYTIDRSLAAGASSAVTTTAVTIGTIGGLPQVGVGLELLNRVAGACIATGAMNAMRQSAAEVSNETILEFSKIFMVLNSEYNTLDDLQEVCTDLMATRAGADLAQGQVAKPASFMTQRVVQPFKVCFSRLKETWKLGMYREFIFRLFFQLIAPSVVVLISVGALVATFPLSLPLVLLSSDVSDTFSKLFIFSKANAWTDVMCSKSTEIIVEKEQLKTSDKYLRERIPQTYSAMLTRNAEDAKYDKLLGVNKTTPVNEVQLKRRQYCLRENLLMKVRTTITAELLKENVDKDQFQTRFQALCHAKMQELFAQNIQQSMKKVQDFVGIVCTETEFRASYNDDFRQMWVIPLEGDSDLARQQRDSRDRIAGKFFTLYSQVRSGETHFHIRDKEREQYIEGIVANDNSQFSEAMKAMRESFSHLL